MSIELPKELITKYAPLVQLHPQDNHRPDSVENYLQMVRMKDANGATLAENVNIKTLETHNSPDNYLSWKYPMPDGKNDFPTGMPLKNGGNGKGICNAPCYYKVRTFDTHYDIIYSFFFPFNGYQPFRAGIKKVIKKDKTRNFPIANLARHQSDWEHITVRIIRKTLKPLGVFYSGHGKSYFKLASEITYAGDHPIVYIAYNTHASYSMREVITEKKLPPLGIVYGALNGIYHVSIFKFNPIKSIKGLVRSAQASFIKWVKAVDISDPLVKINVYRKQVPEYRAVKWDTWKHLVDLEAPQASRFSKFKGKWGETKTDNLATLHKPPALPQGVHHPIKDIIKKLTRLGQLNDYRYGNGVEGPEARNWFEKEEKYNGFAVIGPFGGTGGRQFNDASNIPEGHLIKAIQLRSGSRVDKVCFIMDNNTKIAHGGNGGRTRSLLLRDNERIVSIELSVRAHGSNHRLFWIRFKTSNNRILQGGRRGSNETYHKLVIPEGATLRGMHGRSGSEIDSLGFLLEMEPVTLFDILSSIRMGAFTKGFNKTPLFR